jgi:hypothetical protein
MSKYLEMKVSNYFLNKNHKNGDIIIMTSMNYDYYYFYFCGVVQMTMIIDKKI